MMRNEEPTDPRDPSEQGLDELLRQARWPALDEAAQQRLRHTWSERFDRAAGRWSSPPRAIAAAAALMLILLGGWWVLRPDAAHKHLVILDPAPVQQPVQPVVETRLLPHVEAREPTPFERLLVTATGPKQRATPRPPSTEPQMAALSPGEQERRRILALLRSQDARDHDRFLELVLDERSRPLALDTLRHVPDPPVDALLKQLGNRHAERRLAAARALGEICHADVVERLWLMVGHNIHRREALAALTQCREPQAVRYLALAHENPSFESQLRAIREQMKQIF